MQSENPDPDFSNHSEQSIRLVLRAAKKLHRSATSDSRVRSLPVLRRLISSKAFVGVSLIELFRNRQRVQRKHILRMLALEAGFNSWESFRPLLATLSDEELMIISGGCFAFGYPNLWFSSLEEAERFTAQQGGRSYQVGTQAVVIAREL